VDINDTLRPINAIEKPAASLIADEQRNALEMAEERRKALNLKRTVQTKTDKDGDLVADGATVEPN
jgi:hypothetical protein